jgi:Tfp pilus assembly protein PilF
VRRLAVPIAVVAALGAAAVAWRVLLRETRPAASPPAGFAGAAACAECHRAETEKWRASDHFRSMEVPSAATVLANFDGASFEYHGVTTTFSHADGKWSVGTDGPDGALHDYPVAYTFGFRPLQQFLLPLPGGRLQALNVCWDSRPAADGGQRWFHLYPDETVDSKHPFHWTGPFQNWNHMCADCHSTGLVKGYDAARDAYATTWTDLDVACEACHGPGARHVEWARERAKAPPKDDDGAAAEDPRLDVRFRPLREGEWTFETGNPTAKRVLPGAFRAEIETCGRCHARREPNRAAYAFGRPLEDSFNVSLLVPGLYHADGQIEDEVYEYGSFLQAKMYRRGVTCGDCHDAHTGKVAFPDNRLCCRCHLPEAFDTPKHHFHEQGTKAARCVECHMPSRNYMVIDARRDHSLRVPRPDLTVATGSPNACNGCHADKTPQWAADEMRKRYGEKCRVGTPHYGTAIAAARDAKPGAARRLLAAADDADLAPMARATALSMLRDWMGPDALPAVERASRDEETLVRVGAAETLDALPPERRLSIGLRLLDDPVRGVRVAAASRLAGLAREGLAADAAARVDRGVREYEESQRVNEDRAEAHANLGTIALARGDVATAEAELRRALAMRPSFERAAVNLADVLRAAGRDDEGERVLRDVLPRTLEPGDVHHALGLLLVRTRRTAEAMEHLAKSVELRPGDSHYAYVYAVALRDAGRAAEATDVLRRAQERRPADREVLEALAEFARDAGDREAAVGWARKLVEESLGDPRAAEVLEEAERRGGK